MPWGTGEQVPVSVPRLQAWHDPVQAVLQHTPSAQLPVAHSVPTVQACPRGAVAWHVAAPASGLGEQNGVAPPHWASVVQLEKHPVPLHAKPPQDWVVCVPQVPALHDAERSSVPPVQLCAAQTLVG